MDLIDLYLREYRHLLADEPGDFLFPGKHSGHKVNHALSHQINLTVHTYTGLEMPAHRFRHAVGKIFLDRNPGQYEVVRQLLGHKNIKTTIEFYAGAEGVAAARHYSATILKLRGHKSGGEDGV
jgi:site-specific recombinase XerD